MGDKEFTNKVHMSEVEEPVVRGKPMVKCENRVEEYVRERGKRGLFQARREFWNKNWRTICCGNPLGESFQRGRGIRTID